MNVGDGAQMGDVDATAAGRDIHQVHNDLIGLAKIMQQFTDTLEAQRAADRHERKERQDIYDSYTLGIRGAIQAIREEQAKMRKRLSWLTGWLALLTLALGAILIVVLTRPYAVAFLP